MEEEANHSKYIIKSSVFNALAKQYYNFKLKNTQIEATFSKVIPGGREPNAFMAYQDQINVTLPDQCHIH